MLQKQKWPTWRRLILLLSVLWMVLIFALSQMPAQVSGALSGRMTRRVLEILYPRFLLLTAARQTELTAQAGFLLRKCSHFMEYMVLGALYTGVAMPVRQSTSMQQAVIEQPAALERQTISVWQAALGRLTAAWVMATLYAASDEFHQTFVAGRAGLVVDVCLDSCGAAVGVLLAGLLWRLFT